MSGNPWLMHVKAFHAKHPNMAYSEALKKARATYKKKKVGQKGGSFLSGLGGALSTVAPFAPLLMGLGKRGKRRTAGKA